jgi:hypothetical protein
MWARLLLEEHLPARLNHIYRTLDQNPQGFEPWRLVLTTQLVQSVERNCRELAETIGKDKLSAAAWIARNLLELWVWIKYCGVSKETAWRFEVDVLRDLKGLSIVLGKLSDQMGLENRVIAEQRIIKALAENAGSDEINSEYLSVADAAKTEGVGLGELFGPLNRMLSKFSHPTAMLVRGIPHQDISRSLQMQFTRQGVSCAAYGISEIEAQLGIPSHEH